MQDWETMNDLPQVYGKYDLLFTPRLIPRLRNLRGDEWGQVYELTINFARNPS